MCAYMVTSVPEGGFGLEHVRFLRLCPVDISAIPQQIALDLLRAGLVVNRGTEFLPTQAGTIFLRRARVRTKGSRLAH